jgi:hypothetical protein
VGALVHYGDDALDTMVQIVTELGDDLVNRREPAERELNPSRSSPTAAQRNWSCGLRLLIKQFVPEYVRRRW